jgi:hypothetical protein
VHYFIICKSWKIKSFSLNEVNHLSHYSSSPSWYYYYNNNIIINNNSRVL